MPHTLIVTGDDFGLSREVNEAIEAAHRNGILTGASLMVGAPAAADAVARARRLPSLRVGLHLTLVDGRPLLPVAAVSALVDARGLLARNLVAAGLSVFFRPKARRQMAREIAAQFEAFKATGLELDHVNAHRHFHLHPTVGRYVIEIGRRYRMKAVRVPWERADILARIDGKPAAAGAANRGGWSALLRARLRRHALFTTDYCFGEIWSGGMSEDRLGGLLTDLPPGVTEIYCHPAASSGFDGAVPGFRYEEELQALVSPRVSALARRAEIRLAGFGDLT